MWVRFWMHTQQSSPLTKLHRASPQTMIFLSFTTFGYRPYVNHNLSRFHHSPCHFVRLQLTRLSPNQALIPLDGKHHGSFIIHIGIILSTLGLSPYGFIFWLFPQKTSYHLDVIHAYIFIVFPFIIDVGHYETLNSHPKIK